MLHFLPETDKNFIAFRVDGNWSFSIYDQLYSKLTKRFLEHGNLYVYEELHGFNAIAFLSSTIGIYHDFKYRNDFRINKLAIVSNSRWARLEASLWKSILSFWPIAPKSICCFTLEQKEVAKEWLKK